MTQKETEHQIHSIGTFIRTGLFVLSIVLVASLAVAYGQNHLVREQSASTGTTNTKKLPIYCVDRPDKKIALSFDAAWGNEDTKKMLHILKKNKIHVTFFMTGGWIETYPDDVKAILKEGHELGNHSENHKQMSKLSPEECKTEIMKPHEKVKKLTGVDMKVFRPPYGDYNNTLIETLDSCGYHAIQWDVDSLDWKDYGVDSILNTVLNHKHLGNGSIILCHNGAKYTADALDKLIKELKKKGYTFVKMSELIYDKDYEIDAEGRQHKSSSSTPVETTPPSHTLTQ